MEKKYELKYHIKIYRDSIGGIIEKIIDGELPFKYDGDNWTYDYWCEYTKRFNTPFCAFLTPDFTAKKMADIANRETQNKVLDACCGTGQILKYLNNGIGFDKFGELLEVAKYQNLDVFNFNFTILYNNEKDKLALELKNLDKKYEVIVSNPPFGKEQATGDLGVEFMNWAYNNLEDNGRLIVLLPSDFMTKTQKKYLDIQNKFSILIEEPMEEEFYNTKINASIYLMKKT